MADSGLYKLYVLYDRVLEHIDKCTRSLLERLTALATTTGAYTPLLATDLSIAKVMKKAGYRTAVVGKWGLGNFNTSGYPLAQGFDYYVGQDTQVGCKCCKGVQEPARIALS